MAQALTFLVKSPCNGLDILARYNFTGLFSGRRPYLQRPRPEAREGACTWW
jgi:hypothetical protein